MGYEILYCSRCRAQLRGREFERGDAFRIEDEAVCKDCAPEVVKSLPPNKVQILLKQMVAKGQAAPKTARAPAAPPSPEKIDRPPIASLTPIWIGLGLILVLVLGLGAWVIGGAGQPPPSLPKADVPAARPAPATTPPREPAVPSPSPKPLPLPAADPKVAKEPLQAPSIPGLVGHWTLDEGAGSTVSDSSRTNGPGTLVNGPSWSPGKMGTALSFDGKNSVLNVQTSAALYDLRKRGLTVCAWISPRGGKSGHLVDKSNANVGWLLSYKPDSRIQFAGDHFGAEVSRFSAKPLTLNTWHHVAGTWDGDRSSTHAHLYVNGVPADGEGRDGAGALREGSSPMLCIGNRRTMDRGFDGLIDEVRVYNRVLSASEILSLVNGTPK